VQEPVNCDNCGRVLDGRYCAMCGQEAQALNPRLTDVLHEFAHELFHLDGKLVASTVKLLAAPGQLTRDYFEGRRARWVPPVRLYLVFSLLYFGTTAIVPARGLHVAVSGYTSAEDVAALERMGYHSQEELRDALVHAHVTWAPRVMFVLVPLLAWLVGIAFRRAGRHYPQHLYFALHVHAAWFAAATIGVLGVHLPGLLGRFVGLAALVYGLVYFVAAAAVAYGVSLRASLIRSVVLAPVYAAAVAVTTVAFVAPTVFGRDVVMQVLFKR
jgi:hypothetical protein